MKTAFFGFVLALAPLSAFASTADCGVPTATSVRNTFSTSALASIAEKGGVVRVFSSTRYYSTSNLSTISKAAATGTKGGKLVLCVDDDYYSSGNLSTIAGAGGEVVILN